ncbi:MAG: polysaccharide pyruvyl transferase family protein [Bacteroidales bacterium]|nr:polysaccharide pyruvyl transferase family protein [Bacteroidales bacterium]
MSKKIGILTLPIGRGYGGILQNYALQKVLKKEGADPVTINLRKEVSDIRLVLGSIKRMILTNDFSTRSILTNSKLRYQTEQLRRFIATHIKLSDPITSEEQFSTYVTVLDPIAIVVGSDQVWRPEYTPVFSPYLLQDISDNGIRKYAFSASFGYAPHNLFKSDIKQMTTALRKFDGISLREDDATTYCQTKLKYGNSFTTVDPTMLLKRENYDELLENRIATPTGAFVYLLDSTKEAKERVQIILKNVGMNVFSCEPDNELTPLVSGLKEGQIPSIEQWLSSIRNADLIITDSFHCAVFSSIYGKPFVCIENKNRGNSRFETLKKYVTDDFRFSSTNNWEFKKILRPFGGYSDLFRRRQEISYEYIHRIANNH